MQISDNYIIQASSNNRSMYNNFSPTKSDFSSIFQREMQSCRPKQINNTKTDNQNQNPDPICLGTVNSKTNPTVSHLLIKHPDYGQDCWQTIHSDINANKKYTKIPSGTKIYLNPKTNELSWSTETNSANSAAHDSDKTHLSTFGPGQKANSRTISSYYTKDCGLGVSAEIGQQIQMASQRHNVPERLIRAVIKAESNYHPQAVSSAGAQGLMQLMPATAQELGVNDPFDVKENIDGGTLYLRKMLDTFDGDIKLALAAYNAGPKAIRSHQGLIPYQETQLYVQKVLNYFQETSSPI